jgi:drug/metabolite transporter (DMT)-like permease
MALALAKPRHQGLLFAVLASVVFGLYPAASRAVYADGGNVSAMIIMTAWARGLGMAISCLLTRSPLFQTREDRKQALIGGFFQACSNFGIFLALLYIPGPLVIIIVFTHTLMLLFFMAWRGELKLDFLNVATTVLALFGLTLVLDLWHPLPHANWIGIAFAFMSAVATLSRLYVYGKQTQSRQAIVVGAENFLVAALLTLVALFFQTPQLPVSLAGNAYLVAGCLSLTLGTFFMFLGISRLGAFQYSLMCKIEPIFTSLFSVLVLSEVLGFSQYVGMALVLGSLAAYQVISQWKKPRS